MALHPLVIDTYLEMDSKLSFGSKSFLLIVHTSKLQIERVHGRQRRKSLSAPRGPDRSHTPQARTP